MLLRCTLFILLCSCVKVSAQTLLCSQESVTVYYVTNRTEQGQDYDEWKIYLDIENRTKSDLFYTKIYKGASLAPTELLPSYLNIRVLNGIGTYQNSIHYIHGSVTFHITADTVMMYKVATKRYDKSIITRVKKGETPELEGIFTTRLLPLDSIKKLKLK